MEVGEVGYWEQESVAKGKPRRAVIKESGMSTHLLSLEARVLFPTYVYIICVA